MLYWTWLTTAGTDQPVGTKPSMSSMAASEIRFGDWRSSTKGVAIAFVYTV